VQIGCRCQVRIGSRHTFCDWIGPLEYELLVAEQIGLDVLRLGLERAIRLDGLFSNVVDLGLEPVEGYDITLTSGGVFA